LLIDFWGPGHWLMDLMMVAAASDAPSEPEEDWLRTRRF